MERERLTQLLSSPKEVDREDLQDLRSLVARYPWFSGAQVLHASGEGLAGEILSEEVLNRAAAHVPSRAVLFDLAKSKGVGAFCSPLANEEVRLESVERLPAESEDLVLAQNDVPVGSPVAELPTIEHDELSLTPLLPAESNVAELEEDANDPLERQILEAALASAYDLDLHHAHSPAPEQPLEKAEEFPAPPPEWPLPEPLVEAASSASAVQAPEKEVHEASEERKVAVRGARMRFSSWLDAVPAEVPAPVVPRTPEPEELHLSATPTAEPPSVEERKSIVDRFIAQEIQTIPTKKEFFTPQQAAKRSLDDTAGMVTETLAGIYAKQGSTAKAIEAYRKLALKYPEKSAYFAGLLQTLEAQQHK